MPLAKTKTVWQYLLQVTSLNSNSFQDVAGAASQRLLSYKYALTNNMFYFQEKVTFDMQLTDLVADLRAEITGNFFFRSTL